jgi:hypothetical protein
MLRLHFHKKTVTDDFSGMSGVQTHENGIFLYKSNQAEEFLKTRVTDYFIAGSFLGLVTGMS